MKDRRGIRLEEGQKIVVTKDVLEPVLELTIEKINLLASPHPQFPNGAKKVVAFMRIIFDVPVEADTLDCRVLPPSEEQKKLVEE